MYRFLPILAMATCRGCKACIPDPPYPNTPDTQKQDSGDTDDSADTDDTDTGPPIDTAPEPPCDVPEVEPHSATSPQELPSDQWACGTFTQYDVEIMRFAVDQADWVRMEVRAAAAGSSADVSMQVADASDDDFSAVVAGSTTSSDPFLVFPTDKARSFTVLLRELYGGYGDDYTWELLGSVTKPPVTWTTEEIEPNESNTQATPITEGEVMYGTTSPIGDYDWYSISIPDAEKRDVTVTVVAFAEGSPADLRSVARDPDNVFVKGASSGSSAYDHDPILQFTTDREGTWYFFVTNEDGKGSPVYWYTLSVDITDPPEVDTAASADSGTSAGG